MGGSGVPHTVTRIHRVARCPPRDVLGTECDSLSPDFIATSMCGWKVLVQYPTKSQDATKRPSSWCAWWPDGQPKTPSTPCCRRNWCCNRSKSSHSQSRGLAQLVKFKMLIFCVDKRCCQTNCIIIGVQPPKLSISQPVSVPLSSNKHQHGLRLPETPCPISIVQTVTCETSPEIHHRGLASGPWQVILHQLDFYRPSSVQNNTRNNTEPPDQLHNLREMRRSLQKR